MNVNVMAWDLVYFTALMTWRDYGTKFVFIWSHFNCHWFEAILGGYVILFITSRYMFFVYFRTGECPVLGF
jgi:hypothetical protein